METRKLYYEDCHSAEFTAVVTGCRQTDNGFAVTLDATAFYPEGGGQACDLGTLGGARVLDVQEQGGEIVHLCDSPLRAGSTVAGSIDWERRFDLMQQHTGEHILSGIIHKKYGYSNSGFHIGKEVMEVDFDGPIPADDLAWIEEQANRAVWANLPLRCWIPSPEELPTVAYRTKRALPWPVRIVQVPGIDSCACCGIHAAMTGEVGLIKILSCVKFHRGVRLELVCGSRAYRYTAAVFEQNRQVSHAFSANFLETGEAARKMNDTLSAEKLRGTGLQMRLLDGIAQNYVNQQNVLHFEPGLEPGLVRELADRIAGVCRGWAAVFSGDAGQGWNYCLASRQTDLRELGRQLTQSLNGRGGGKPNFQQGNVKAEKAEIEAFFQKPLAL